MDLFKERLKITLTSFITILQAIGLTIILLFAIFILVAFPKIIFGGLGILLCLFLLYCFVHWLFIEPYKTHKKAKNEHSTKFKVN